MAGLEVVVVGGVVAHFHVDRAGWLAGVGYDYLGY
jgi:hypothetical protein